MSSSQDGVSDKALDKALGKVFVLSAPAGTGKTTLSERLIDDLPNLQRLITCTTRAPRSGEEEGRDYFFLSPQRFEEKIQKGDFLEYVKLYGNYYGSPKDWVYKQLEKGKDLLLVIDVQGAKKVRAVLDAVYIFLKPPSIQVLEERLLGRKSENSKELERRLARAQDELKEADFYDYYVINEDIEKAYEELCHIILEEKNKKV